MGRVKVAPTPRNLALDAAMRRAAANITSSSSLRPDDVPRPLQLPLPEPRHQVPSRRPSAPVARPSKGSVNTRSSVESQESLKRKSDSTDNSAPPAKKAATAKLTLRSSAKTIDASTKDVVSATSLIEPTRRSTRSSKATSTAPVDSTSLELARRSSAAKSARLVKPQKKSAKANTSGNKGQEHHQAIALLQGEDFLDENHASESIESPAPAASARASTRGKTYSVTTSRRASARLSATLPDDSESDENYDVLPTITSVGQIPAPVDSVGSPAPASLVKLAPATPESVYESKEFDYVDSIGLPSAIPYHSAPVFQSQAATSYVYPDPNLDSSPFNSSGEVAMQNLKADHGFVDGGSSATSGDSGYVTSHPPPQPAYIGGGGLQFLPLAPATPETRNQAFHFVVSTKGQKVKGRPTPRNPKPREVTPRSARNVANTYPRKQPFKAQIEFTGYPPSNADVPSDFTLWEICQNYPNNLREGVLLGFVQREWSANELCACLKDDAREILNGRPGKDKTMVFQKRMERIKKDLVAKGEYDGLINGEMIREDGRPTWVKRGNVRRK